MTLSRIGRISKALVVSMAVVLGMSACGGYTVGFMWVTGGTAANGSQGQIAGLKIDDFTGNLTTMVNSPYASGGSNAVSISVRLGGNFVFVVNKGTATGGVPNGDGNVAVFAVGEDGTLTFQQSYSTAGNSPIWAVADAGGGYVYVLDQRAPDYNSNPASGPINLDGDITVFSVDGSTGRLQLVTNQRILDPVTLHPITYFEVGPVPTTLRVGGGCVYTLDSGDQSILPYGLGAQGQLVFEPNSKIFTNTVSMTSLNVSGSNLYATDAGANRIVPYTTGGANCSLSPEVDGPVANLALTSDPVFSMTDGKGKYLYVLNHGTNNPNVANSTISAYVIEPTGGLVPVSDVSNPYPVGNGPICMVEDPSNQYVYTANQNDGTVTGKRIDPTTGQLYDLARGSTFQATALASCLAVSGNVD